MNTTAVHYIKIASININGIRNKKLELISFAEEQNLDVILIQETLLQSKHKFTFPNFATFRDDRDARGGGTMILVKRHIQASSIPNPDVCNKIEGTFVDIATNRGPLIIGSVYCRPTVAHNFDPICLDNIFSENRTIIVGGDLNAKNKIWKCRSTNHRGNMLYEYSDVLDYHILPPEDHTHLGSVGLPEILDIFIIKNTTRVSQPIAVHALSSDHIPVLLDYGDPKKRGICTITKTQTNWDKFRKELNSNGAIAPIGGKPDIDTAVASITNNIKQAYERASTTKTFDYSKFGNLSENIKNEIRIKNRLKNRAYRSGDPQIKNLANQATNRVKRLLSDLSSQRWEEKVESLDLNYRNLYQMTRALTKGRNYQMPHLTTADNLIITRPAEKAEKFAELLYEQFSENPPTDIQNENQINRTVGIYKSIDHTLEANVTNITSEEVKLIIHKLKTKKAPGLDGITNLAIKNLPEKTIKDITTVAQSIFKQGYFPTAWKRAKVVMIPKKGNKKLFSSYRPISLLSGLSKLVEGLIACRLKAFLEDNNCLPNEQFGFRAGLCTVRQTTRLASNILTKLNVSKPTGAIFFDISKAFDKVWHNGLILKLVRLGTPNQLTSLIAAYLENRTFQTYIDGTLSSIKQARAGVPQGSVIGPILFNAFTADLPSFASTKRYIFCDDLSITASAHQPRAIIFRLQQHVNILEKWLQKWKLSINPEKTQAIYFSKKRSVGPGAQVVVANTRLNWKTDVKYLGLRFDRQLTWKSNTAERIASARAQFALLYSLINYKSRLNIKTKVTMYKTFIRSALTYGAPAWCTLTKTDLTKVQRFQNRVLRTILHAPRYTPLHVLHRELEIETISQFLSKIIHNYHTKATASLNAEIQASHIHSRPNAKYKLPKDWILDHRPP